MNGIVFESCTTFIRQLNLSCDPKNAVLGVWTFMEARSSEASYSAVLFIRPSISASRGPDSAPFRAVIISWERRWNKGVRHPLSLAPSGDWRANCIMWRNPSSNANSRNGVNAYQNIWPSWRVFHIRMQSRSSARSFFWSRCQWSSARLHLLENSTYDPIHIIYLFYFSVRGFISELINKLLWSLLTLL